MHLNLLRVVHSMLIVVCLASTLQILTPHVNAQDKLAGTDWKLISFGRVGSESKVLDGTTITLKFNSGRASGSSGCNSYSGSYNNDGESLTFGQMISTMRACLDNKANQQEQSYLAALGAARKVKFAGSQLAIFYDGERSVLNFTNSAASSGDTVNNSDSSTPISVLVSYYSAINAKRYDEAFRLWDHPTTTLETFKRGFADTANAQLLVDPTKPVEGAAGSMYANLPAIIVARDQKGSAKLFVGCYVLRKSNVESDTPNPGWQIYKGNLSPAGMNTSVAHLLSRSCRD